MIIQTSSILTSESWIIDADHPHVSPRVFEPRQFDVFYIVEYHADGSNFFVLSNIDKKRNFSMYYTPINLTSKDNW